MWVDRYIVRWETYLVVVDDGVELEEEIVAPTTTPVADEDVTSDAEDETEELLDDLAAEADDEEEVDRELELLLADDVVTVAPHIDP